MSESEQPQQQQQQQREDADSQQQQHEASAAVQIDPTTLSRFLQSDAQVTCFPVVEGLSKTAPQTILNELTLVSGSTTVRELIRNAEYARHRWRRLNVFADIEFNLEPLADGKPDDVVIRFFFTERKSFKEISIMSSESGTMPEVKATLHNFLGRAYDLSAHVTPSSLRTLSYSAHLISHLSYVGERTEYVVSRTSEQHPLHYGDQERVEQAKVVVHFDNSAELAAQQSLKSQLLQNHSNDDENADGKDKKSDDEAGEATDNNSNNKPPSHWRQTVSFGLQRRRIVPKDSTPESIGIADTATGGGTSSSSFMRWRGIPGYLQHHFAPCTKAFLKYELRYNTVQHLPMPWYEVFPLPVSGTDFCATAEVAGGLLGGDTSLARTEVQVIQHRTLFPFVVLDLGFRGGFAAGFGGSEWFGQDARWGEGLRLVDRFYLNWRNVRGFLAVGPNTNEEADARGETPPKRFRCLGGNAVWAASATLNFPFPLWPSNGLVSSHLFANVGNLALIENAQHAWASVGDFFVNKVKASVGIGLTAMQIPSLGPVPNGRLELNFSVPLALNAGGGGGAGADASNNLSSPWVFDKIRWGLHWTSL